MLPWTHHLEHGMLVRELGEPGKQTLLWLHGLGSWGECFGSVMGRVGLAARHQLAPDLPGYGRSAWTAEPLTLTELTDHVATWLRGRPVGPVTVIGHSLGGVVAQILAERAPDVVRAVVDVEGNISSQDCSVSRVVTRQGRERFCAGGIDALAAEVFRQAKSSATLRDYYVSLRLCDPRAFHAHSMELVALSDSELLAEQLAELSVPTCYIAGDAAGAAGPRSIELLARACVPCRVIAGAGHVPFLDQPERFVQALVDWLADPTVEVAAPAR